MPADLTYKNVFTAAVGSAGMPASAVGTASMPATAVGTACLFAANLTGKKILHN